MINSTLDPRQVQSFEDLLYNEELAGAGVVEASFQKFPNPRPYVTVIGFAVDDEGRFPIFKRSKSVRSARNAWSIPSGLHEVGKPMEVQFANELQEELNLTAIAGTCQKIGFYEAIIYQFEKEPNWHWVLTMLAVRVEDLSVMRNKEPDKHSDIQIVTLDRLYSSFMDETWTMGLKEALLDYRPAIENAFAQYR